MLILITFLAMFLVGLALFFLGLVLKESQGWQWVCLILGGLLTASPFLLAAYLLWLMKTV